MPYLSTSEGRTSKACRNAQTPAYIPKWKCDEIAMDFIVGLPRTPTGENAIWVVVDRLTKSAHFIPVKVKDPMDKLVRLYVQNIVRLHGVPSAIVSDRDSRFTLRFWQSLQKEMRTKIKFSTAFTLRPMASQSELIKFWKICFELVFWISRVVGFSFCL
jgi:hypothetical protein